MKVKLVLLATIIFSINAFGDDIPSYSRAEFGHSWADTDGDCLDTRQEILIRDSVYQVTIDDCRVVNGLWFHPYANTTEQPNFTTSARSLDIDHVIPLKWAWTRGEAWRWSKEKRIEFANDPENLIAVDSSENRSKGARGPDLWLPANKAFVPIYIDLWNRLIVKYWLSNYGHSQ